MVADTDESPESYEVLVVDHDGEIRASLAAVFSNERIRVLCVDSGEAALEALQRARPKVVIARDSMPHVSGWDLLRTVRADKALADVRVVVTTADPSAPFVAGADQLLRRPYGIDELISAVRPFLPTSLTGEMTCRSTGVTTACLFELAGNMIVRAIGTVMTATLFRRAARAALANWPELTGLQQFDVTRDGLEYRYVLPSAWHADLSDVVALQHLVTDTLMPLLATVTGTVVLSQLEREPVLRTNGFFPLRSSENRT